MTAMLIGSGIDSVCDLMGILPPDVRVHVDPTYLAHSPNAAALRVLATIHATYWHRHVSAAGIEWRPLLEHACQRKTKISNSERVRLEIAASLAGFPGAHVQLLYASRVMGRHDFLAVLDALRIVVEGLKP